MSPAEANFLYSPLLYWVTFAVLLYRHDLSRLFHPFRDNGTRRSWWIVLNQLGLLGKEEAERRPGKRGEFLPYAIYLAISTVASLSWVLGLYPPLWYYLVVAQVVSAIVLTAATIQYLGPPPRRPYVDVLRFPRLGSRLRHLPRVPSKDEGDSSK